MDQHGERPPMSREEMMSALFANMVLQQANMAMMFLGRVPHPETGEKVHDLEMAQVFIDQLEMLEAKTKNNLSKQEQAILKQSLTGARLAYVEAASESKGATTPKAEVPPAPKQAPGGAGGQPSATAEQPSAGESDESRKKFTKKY